MYSRRSRSPSRRTWVAALVLAGSLPLSSCESKLLDFNDPDIVDPGSAQSASGAIALKNGTIRRFTTATSGDESTWLFGGLLADEWRSGDTFEQRNSTDRRAIDITNSFLTGQMLILNRVRYQGQQAIQTLRTYAPSPISNVGLMFALIGYAEVLMGENYCNGLAFSEVAPDGSFIYGTRVTVDSAFKRAAASADSALANTDGSADGVKVANLARIVKGRALLNLNRPADAAAAVATVPTGYSYTVGHSNNTTTNQIWSLNTGAKRYVVANNEGGNGLPFASANDPRLPVTTGGLAFDTQTPFASQTKYGQFDSVSAANGTEARLIEAEAALRADAAVTWLDKLNAPRALKTGLAPLTDPVDPTARINLTFYERGFWFFGLGHRLGDLRRLVRQYARGAETVFPTGTFPKGANYGTNTSIPIAFDETNNPNYVQGDDTCLDRNP